jgi:hypothetical protein
MLGRTAQTSGDDRCVNKDHAGARPETSSPSISSSIAISLCEAGRDALRAIVADFCRPRPTPARNDRNSIRRATLRIRPERPALKSLMSI